MARRYSYNGATKAIALTTAQSIVFTASDIASERVVAYHFAMQAANNDLGAITRIRMMANGVQIVNVTPAQLRAYMQAFSVGAALKPPTAQQVLTVPLCLLDAPTPEMQDICQFPARSEVQIEITTDNSTAAGYIICGWTETDQAPELYPRLLAQSMNIPASTVNQRFNFQSNGPIRGLCLPTAGLDRARFVLGGQEYLLLPGAAYLGNANQGDMLLESQSLYGNGVSSAGTPLTDPVFVRLTGGVPAPVQSSFVELVTQAGWAGVGAELVQYDVNANGPGVV
jgi:hypothetical protein